MHRCPHKTRPLILLASITAFTVPICANQGFAQSNVAAAASAQGNPVAGSPDAQNPSSPMEWQLGGGYLMNLTGSPANAGYYKLLYKGQLLSKSGTPPTLANVGKPFDLLPSRSNAGGDSSDTLFSLDRGNAQVNGFLAQFFKEESVRLGNVPFRLAANLTARGDGKQYNLALGAESQPIHPLHWLNQATGLGITNYVMFGFSGQHEFRSDTLGTDQDTALLTYRAFIGRGFQWVKSKKLQSAVDALNKTTINRVKPPTAGSDFYGAVQTEYKNTREGLAKVKTLPSVEDTFFLQLVELIDGGSLDKPKTLDDWKKLVSEYTKDFHSSHMDRPSYAIWIDSSAWYDLTGRIDATTAPARFNNLFGATLKIWLNPKGESENWLQVRYENGRDRSAPTINKNAVYFSIGTSF